MLSVLEMSLLGSVFNLYSFFIFNYSVLFLFETGNKCSPWKHLVASSYIQIVLFIIFSSPEASVILFYNIWRTGFTLSRIHLDCTSYLFSIIEVSSQAYVGQMKTNSTNHRSQYYVKELHIFNSTHIIQHYLTDQLKRNTCLISNGNVFSNCMFERYTNNGGCLLNRFLNSFWSFWNCLLIAFFNHLLCFTLYVNADDVLTSAKVMKFVRASHCVCPILGLSSSGSVLLVQTMHPDPPGTSRHIRETQSNKTELLSNTHVLTSSALPYGSVIKPWREVFLSMCVCVCACPCQVKNTNKHIKEGYVDNNKNEL